MQASTLYQSIYTYFGDTTPLLADCGALCGKACCGGDSGNSDGRFNNADSLCDSSEETGMYLFPGEKPLFLNRPGFQVVPSERQTGGPAVVQRTVPAECTPAVLPDFPPHSLFP